jgi:hypothetical protein
MVQTLFLERKALCTTFGGEIARSRGLGELISIDLTESRKGSNHALKTLAHVDP